MPQLETAPASLGAMVTVPPFARTVVFSLVVFVERCASAAFTDPLLLRFTERPADGLR